MKIVYLNIEELKTNPNNAKLHTPEQIAQIKESIREFGFNDPLGVDEDYMILEGHGRFLAAQELGYEKVPVFILKGLNEAQKAAYALVHNQLTNNTGFDMDILQEELDAIEEFDMSKYSFWTGEADFFEDGTNEEDHRPEPKGIIVAQANDLQADLLREYLLQNELDFEET